MGQSCSLWTARIGSTDTKNEIWLYERMAKGKVIINQAILGHELNRLLSFVQNQGFTPSERFRPVVCALKSVVEKFLYTLPCKKSEHA